MDGVGAVMGILAGLGNVNALKRNLEIGGLNPLTLALSRRERRLFRLLMSTQKLRRAGSKRLRVSFLFDTFLWTSKEKYLACRCENRH